MIRGAGSNGIVAIIWAAVCRRKINGRLSAGRRCAGTFGRLNETVNRAPDLPPPAAAGPSALGLR